MDLTQKVTLELTEAECRDYVIELGEQHGLGVRQRQLEGEVAYRREAMKPQPPFPQVAPQGQSAWHRQFLQNDGSPE